MISGLRAKGFILDTPVSQVVQRVNIWNARDRHEEFLPPACIIVSAPERRNWQNFARVRLYGDFLCG